MKYVVIHYMNYILFFIHYMQFIFEIYVHEKESCFARNALNFRIY